MKYSVILISLLLISCSSEKNYWHANDQLFVIVESDTLIFSGTVKDSLVSILEDFEVSNPRFDHFENLFPESEHGKMLPTPYLLECIEVEGFLQNQYRSILLHSLKEIPESYFVSDKYFRDRKYEAVWIRTDTSGSEFIEWDFVYFRDKPPKPDSLFFPKHVFSVEVPDGFEEVRESEISSHYSRSYWYQDWLLRMDETSLYQNCTESINKFRVSWFPSFHPPLSITIEQTDRIVMSVAKYMERIPSPDYYSSHVTIENEFSNSVWDEFISIIASANFWELATTNREYRISNKGLITQPVGNDGAQWIVEGCNNGNYHVVDRWSRSFSSEYEQIFTFLESLHQLDLDYIYKY